MMERVTYPRAEFYQFLRNNCKLGEKTATMYNATYYSIKYNGITDKEMADCKDISIFVDDYLESNNLSVGRHSRVRYRAVVRKVKEFMGVSVW